ncbi:acetyl-CoA synthetase-like protein [Aspergillus steynii IBT 23096]|uniref:Acetyl-CoA synthetase-like protein n=1 Tax=Aspergillus steynii IBT 23096 TaxID=1392250 RepID=A0A2I2FWX7_9EURO|nr:acetyl-CoA synthetase-like protein [Aspergillus steynii IBT 23096]PLB45140.1 acetyl-CoA synthetase-like protein [Aspergillus steynii IBT 23096]
MDKLCIFEGPNDDRSNEPHEAAQGSTVDNEERAVASQGRRNGDKRYLLSEADMLKLKEWNGLAPEQVDQCLHTLIVERCRAQESAPAVCAWDGELTYGEMDVLSSALAVHLKEHGVGMEMFLPLCFEKSRWTSVAILGVLKAGAAFVLLDPKQPLSRLQELCSTVNAALVLSSSANQCLCEKLAGTVVVPSSVLEAPSLYGPQGSTPTAVVRPHNAAYASFTSGSTGRPKAVVVEHSAICSNALAHNAKLHLHEASRVLQSASYAFGASILQMVMTWIAGGCVCVPSESECRDSLAAAARNFKVNWAFFTPSFLRIVRPRDLSSLKHVFLGGEPPARSDITAWADNVQVSGAYGSAECSILCAIVENMRSLSIPQSIGQMTGSVGWVVEPDDHHQLAPLGMVGELLVEGPSLARGYLGDSNKTAQVFIEAPIWFSEYWERFNKTIRRAGRMYKTGDLVRYNPDGSLTFVGRKDTQVKLHGQRVELGEVEHHIRGSLSGNDAPPVVAEVVTPCGSDHPLLVAFIAAGETSRSPDPAQAALKRWVQGLGDWLAERLPRYMVPSAYVAIDTIPLTATGKTDRRRLREIGAALTPEQLADLLLPSRSALDAPATAIEKQLLGLISTTDNFLRIGGDSITAVQLVGAARDQGLSLTVTQIFDAPRLCDMASVVRAEGDAEETILPFSLLRPGTDVDLARAQVASQCGVEPNLVEDIFPCTSLQEGMLAITVKRPGNYVHQAVLEMSGDGDTVRLERAWREVVATIPILRTQIVNLAGQGLVQVVIAEQDTFTVGSDIGAYLEADKQEPMGLGTPLARFGIIDSPRSQRPVVVCTIHHALFDGWSMSLVRKQVEQAYLGRPRDRLVPLQGFVRHILQNTEGANEYWQSQLGQSEAVPFPSLPSPGHQPEADDVLQHQISGLQWPQNDITPSTAIRTAWAILLGQYTNTADVIFGATVTGRQMPVPGVERMAGPTIATVPVRVRLDWEADIHVLLQKVQAQGTSMTPYEQMGLQQIRRISPDTERACQFQNLLVVQPPAPGNGRNDQDTRFKLSTKTENEGGDATWRNTFNTYAMMVECYLEEDGTMVWISFDSRVMDRVQIQRIARQLEHVLHELCAQQRGQVQTRDICGPSKGDHQELEQWNRKVPERVDRCVHELIAERCQSQPDAAAVCAWDGDFTYTELDRLSSVLAAHLSELGVGPEVFVSLCFEKSRWTTVAILGVIKAGGAFVLLDPSHPRAWLQAICHMVSARVTIASVKQKGIAAELPGHPVLLGTEENKWREHTQAAISPARPDNALYAVCTSGSTGSPKGTIIEHASFCTSASSYSRASHLTSQSRVFQFSAYAFDASIIENLTTLLVGGCICVPSDGARQDHIGAAASQLGATWAELTPSTARLLQGEDLATVETLVFIGEPVTAADITRRGKVKLVNAYGPAECSAISSVQSSIRTQDTRNIGQGAGCVHWVVDPQDCETLLPIGAIGELVIEGPVVGRGYLNSPEKTAAAFIDPPAWLRKFRGDTFTSQANCVYRTGDLVQYAADGSLRFIGRKDTQVKLRGQRIELNEVEVYTHQYFPGAQDVVAEVVTLTETGRQILVAFVCLDMKTNCHEKGIVAPPTDIFRAAIPTAEARLHDVVPSYMVPAVFLQLAAIPLTTTGKTDRRRLRSYATALSEIELYSVAASVKRAPTTVAEQILQRLWTRVLNVSPDAIGADDSFFRIGGDSITAMQLSALARTEGFTLSVSDIFHYKTVAGLAPLLDMKGQQPSLDAEELCDVLFELSPIQSLFFETVPNGADYFNQSFLIPLAGPVASHELACAIPMIVDHHPMLRARFSQRSDGTWYQAVCTDSDTSYRYHHSVVTSLQEAKPVMQTSQQSLGMRNGPLFSVDLIDISPDEQQYIFLVAHHLVIDLVSWRIVLGDLEDILQNGHVYGIKPFPFQAWCELQAEYAHNHLGPTEAFPSRLPPAVLDYWGTNTRQNTWDTAIHCSFTVSERITSILFGKANDALNTQSVDIFQAAL